MPDLSPICALGGATPRHADIGALTLSENAMLGLASLALRRGWTRPAPFGLDLPGAGRCVSEKGVGAVWIGPEQWMIEAAGRGEEDFAADLKAEAAGCSVTDQTDGWCAIEITSKAGAPPLMALLEKLVNIDLAQFGPGSATRTGLEHMSVFVLRRAEHHVAVIGMRSLAEALWHALERAAERLEVAA